MNSIEAVFFNIDNVLLDRSETMNRFVSELLMRYMPHIMQNDDSVVEKTNEVKRLDNFGHRLKHDVITDIVNHWEWGTAPGVTELEKYWEDNFPRLACPIKQSELVLNELRKKGIKLGIISNGHTLISMRKLKSLGITNYFDIIVISENEGYSFPDKQLADLAIKRIGVEPSKCLYIGDDCATNIIGAKEAGMNVVIFGNTSNKVDTQIISINKLKDILDLI